ncbi:AfsR/SARP family transcriptional regulator [Actinophytocola oryzae]|uniref:Pentatricopeptide repeat protein n=1 Tax=Actinophytocola oryzae TaxID=502181 RepID=A0A4V6Q6Y2_9PSEU|nr:AfsR/SARP family transcriptional regulator [Actinophytocola oryzae]TDV55041.1 pentatricopeptide repeat protein [Actinophytocola oryzae]
MIEFQVLGMLRVFRDGKSVPLAATMLCRLLAVLLARANEPVSTERLIESLWLGAPPRTGRKTLQIYVHRLRVELGEHGRIVHGVGGYRLVVDPATTIDSVDFETLIRRAGAARTTRSFEQARELLRTALELWRGPAFTGFTDMSVAEAAARRLTELRLTGWEQRAELDLALGRHEGLIAELPGLIADYPFHEALRAHLMLALCRSGRPAEALEVYRQIRGLLATELGLEPCRGLRELHHAILRGDAHWDHAVVLSDEGHYAARGAGTPRPARR